MTYTITVRNSALLLADLVRSAVPGERVVGVHNTNADKSAAVERKLRDRATGPVKLVLRRARG